MPLYVALVIAAALGLALVRGTLLARQRQADLQPARVAAAVALTPEQVASAPVDAEARFLLLQVRGADHRRLALHQVFPQRRLVRWIEPREAAGDLVLLPLTGLRDGTYAVSVALPGEQAGPVEMDANPALREELGSFALSRR
jgi:hypothetical protein